MDEGSRAAREHKEHAPAHLRLAVITISDTKDEASDASGRILREGAEASGHEVVTYAIVRDEVDAIRGAIRDAVARGVDAILTNGGTGVAKRDVTVEAVAPLLDKVLDGFGDLFRLLSFQDVGSAAMLSRAIAGVHRGVAVFCMPGSPDAVRLAWDRLVAPELPHLVGLLRK